VYAAGESDGILFMAMRLVDGLDLRDILRRSEAFPLDRSRGSLDRSVEHSMPHTLAAWCTGT
jgi:hypothetical protein